MSTATKLRPCPFCGSKNVEHVEGSYEVKGVKTTTRNVLCNNCNACGPDTVFDEGSAAYKWNRRRKPRALRRAAKEAKS